MPGAPGGQRALRQGRDLGAADANRAARSAGRCRRGGSAASTCPSPTAPSARGSRPRPPSIETPSSTGISIASRWYTLRTSAQFDEGHRSRAPLTRNAVPPTPAHGPAPAAFSGRPASTGQRHPSPLRPGRADRRRASARAGAPARPLTTHTDGRPSRSTTARSRHERSPAARCGRGVAAARPRGARLVERDAGGHLGLHLRVGVEDADTRTSTIAFARSADGKICRSRAPVEALRYGRQLAPRPASRRSASRRCSR